MLFRSTPATIQSCWRRSQCIDFGAFPAPSTDIWTESEETVDSMRTLLHTMRQRGIIQSVPNVHEYISPYNGPWNERIDDLTELDELVDKIVEENTQQEVDLEDEEGQLYRAFTSSDTRRSSTSIACFKAL